MRYAALLLLLAACGRHPTKQPAEPSSLQAPPPDDFVPGAGKPVAEVPPPAPLDLPPLHAIAKLGFTCTFTPVPETALLISCPGLIAVVRGNQLLTEPEWNRGIPAELIAGTRPSFALPIPQSFPKGASLLVPVSSRSEELRTFKGGKWQGTARRPVAPSLMADGVLRYEAFGPGGLRAIVEIRDRGPGKLTIFSTPPREVVISDGAAGEFFVLGPNDIWLHDQEHLFHWDGARVSEIPLPPDTGAVFELAVTTDGRVWVGATGKLSLRVGTSWATGAADVANLIVSGSRLFIEGNDGSLQSDLPVVKPLVQELDEVPVAIVGAGGRSEISTRELVLPWLDAQTVFPAGSDHCKQPYLLLAPTLTKAARALLFSTPETKDLPWERVGSGTRAFIGAVPESREEALSAIAALKDKELDPRAKTKWVFPPSLGCGRPKGGVRLTR